MFNVGRSMFDVHQFLSRSNWPSFRPAAGLTPETRPLKPKTYNLGFIEDLLPDKML
jgi:hypothetical protein